MSSLISIIIPVYNVKDYLEKCLHSVCGQTYKNLEIIVVDDGSTDGSGEICDRFAQADSRIKVIHQPNSGQSSARNKGLSIARGAYLGFVDSDDWIDLDMYEFLCRLLEDNDADISVCAHYIERAATTEVRYSSGMLTSFSGAEAVRAVIDDKRIRNYLWDKLYKRELFDDIRLPKGEIFEDMAVSCRLFYKAHRIVMQDCPKYHYLQREGSTTQVKQYDPRKDHLWFLRMYGQVKFAQENNIWDEAPRYVHKSGMRVLRKMLLLPSSPSTDAIIADVLAKMREFNNAEWVQVKLCRAVYRSVKLFFKAKV